MCCLCVLFLADVTTVQSFEPPMVRSKLFRRSMRPAGQYSYQYSHVQESKTRLQSAFLSTAIATLDTFWKTSPYAAAAITCGFKASAADIVAQKRQYKQRADELKEEAQVRDSNREEKQEMKTDLQRNVAYILYGALYQGLAQEFIYNHLYPVLFGTGTDVRTVLSKVLFDLLIQTTIVTLPIAYMSKALIYRYSFREAFRRYSDDIKNHGLLVKYFSLWGPVQCVTFSIIPEHFRVTFIACVSFFWLIILSSIASKTPITRDEECSLVDGQAYNIDG
jgi:hypothetical protein